MAEKKFAVLVTDRESEALRMSLGLLLLGDTVDVYVLDRKLEKTEDTALHLATMEEMEMKVYTNCRQNAKMEYLPTEEIARKLSHYDHILPY
jgi:hypothetical protein